MPRLRLLFAVLVFPAVCFAQFEVTAERRTTKTGETGSSYSRTTSYVDRIVLSVTLPREADRVVASFVARDPASHALSYHGHTDRTVPRGAAGRVVKIESDGAAYSRTKIRTETAQSPRGEVPHGWVVRIFSGSRELAVRASAPEILRWVDDRPPQRRYYSAP